MSAELKRRGKAANTSIKPSSDGTLGKRVGSRFKMEWDLIFWLFASFAMLYFTDFASHILFNPVVKRGGLMGGVLAIAVCVCCLMYANKRHPSLNTTNWHQLAPAFIAVATILALTGIISMWVAIWPVWRFYTLLMMPTLLMGFISTVSLFNL